MEIELLADLEGFVSKATTPEHLVYLLKKTEYVDPHYLLSALRDFWLESIAKLTAGKLKEVIEGEVSIENATEAISLYAQLEEVVASQKMLMSDNVWKSREASREAIDRLLRLMKKRKEEK